MAAEKSDRLRLKGICPPGAQRKVSVESAAVVAVIAPEQYRADYIADCVPGGRCPLLILLEDFI